MAQSFASSSLIFLDEGRRADLVQQELDARLVEVLAQQARQVTLAVEDAQDRLGDADVLAVVERGELPDRVGQARHRRGTTADAQLEAVHSFARWRRCASRAMKPRSWKLEPALSAPLLENEVLNLRGRRWQIGLRSMLRA